MTRLPEEIVAEFISHANKLHDDHAPTIKEISDKRGKCGSEDPQKEKLREEYWVLIRNYKQKHKELCEKFGITITNNNFSETRYESPCAHIKDMQ